LTRCRNEIALASLRRQSASPSEARAVPGPNRRFSKRFTRPRGPSAQQLITRAQRLIDTPRPPNGYSVGWSVEAKHLGDLNAIAITAIRAEMDRPTGDPDV
jgi:hypothetical protein